MHRFVLMAAFAALTGACSLFRGGRLSEAEPAHRSALSTSIVGDWVLASSPDSTAFVGARLVELSLSRSAFVIRAHYPGQDTLMVTGVVVSDDPAGGGPLTLIPETNSRVARGARSAAMMPGERIAMIATAADNTLVFAPAEGSVVATSVWHRKEAAAAAGRLVDPRVPPSPPGRRTP